MEINRQNKAELLHRTVKHIDITAHDPRALIDAYKEMSFSARELGRACELYERMLQDRDCTIILTVAGSTSAAGCMQVYVDLVRHNMVDIVVATGATVVDMDFFEALGFRHYRGASSPTTRSCAICTSTASTTPSSTRRSCSTAIGRSRRSPMARAAALLLARVHRRDGALAGRQPGARRSSGTRSSRSPMSAACRSSARRSPTAARVRLVAHQVGRPDGHVSIDSVRDFRELTELKLRAKDTGLLMIGGGSPKNFAQDTVVCAEILGHEVPMHKYSVQITVADVRDGACSSSSLKEASSWGKVDASAEQMVFAEATLALPLLAAYGYHNGSWKKRPKRELARLLG